MVVLYPNLCFNEVCYKGTALYLPYYTVNGVHMPIEFPDTFSIGYFPQSQAFIFTATHYESSWNEK